MRPQPQEQAKKQKNTIAVRINHIVQLVWIRRADAACGCCQPAHTLCLAEGLDALGLAFGCWASIGVRLGIHSEKIVLSFLVRF